MKTSRKLLLVGLAVLVVTILILILVGRSLLIEPEYDMEEMGHQETMNLDYEGFTGIFIDGWDVDIEKSDDFSINISYPAAMKNYIEIEKKDDELIMTTVSRRGVHLFRQGFDAIITMPSLQSLMVEGTSNVSMEDFEEESIKIGLVGIGKIKAENSSVRFLEVTLDGIGDIELNGMITDNANVYLNGTGEIELNMDGGVLEGVLEGLGSIRYTGYVSNEQIEIDGLGQVEFER